MVVAGRRKSIAFFIALGAGMVLVISLLYVGWVLLGWRTGILLFLGMLLSILIMSGVVLNTIFLVREIRRNEQHDAFINAVTHELKTPVASIRLYLETLQTRPVDEEKRKDFYRIMLADSDRLLATIEQVLRTGRAGHNSRKLNLSEFDLAPAVETCIDRARMLHGASQDAVDFRPGDSLKLKADHEEIQSAVFNLVDNALKYSGKSGRIRVEIDRLDGKYALIRVKDNGPGIPKSDLTRIFRRFYRVPGTLSIRAKGTGLGLYIVKSVAKRHGGRVWAESDGPGHGSTFVLQLPMTK